MKCAECGSESAFIYTVCKSCGKDFCLNHGLPEYHVCIIEEIHIEETIESNKNDRSWAKFAENMKRLESNRRSKW